MKPQHIGTTSVCHEGTLDILPRIVKLADDGEIGMAALLGRLRTVSPASSSRLAEGAEVNE